VTDIRKLRGLRDELDKAIEKEESDWFSPMMMGIGVFALSMCLIWLVTSMIGKGGKGE